MSMPDQDLKQRIEELVEQHRDAIVQGLSSLVKFKTVSGGKTEEDKKAWREEIERCLGYLGEQARDKGFEWKNVDNEYAFAQFEADSKPFVALPVHVDVVPVGEGWTHDPFGGEVDQECIWGRGCQDDKGPAIAVLWAMQVLRQLQLELKRGVRMVVGTEEESGDWEDVARYLGSETPAEYTVVPDAAFPIINGEKGTLNLRLRCAIAGDVAASVGGYRFKSAKAGDRPNIVPSQAELLFAAEGESDDSQLRKELERFLAKTPEAKAQIVTDPSAGELLIRFEGKSAHGSAPQEGHNAAVDLLLFMTQSGYVSDDEADLAGFLHEVGADFSGTPLGIQSTHPFIGPTTVNLGILHWSDGQAEAVLNIRNTLGLSSEETVSRIQQRLRDFAEETGFETSAEAVGKAREAIYMNPEDYPLLIDSLKEAYTTFTGREAGLQAIGGTTYAKAFPRALCFGPIDPAEEPDLIHRVDERVRIDHLLRNVKIYSYALAKLCTA